MRALGIDPVHDTRRTFRALCDVTSRPGTVERLPVDRADHAVVATLVDHEVTLYTPDDELREALATQGRLEEAPPEEATVVHAQGVPTWDVRDLERGSLVEPSEGATAIYRLESLASGREDGLTTATFSGPGIPDARTASVALPADELEALAEAQSAYPCGVDAVLTAGDRVLAIPRSVSVEVDS